MVGGGGRIAWGFWLSGGGVMGCAGPAVIISYVIAGIITVAVMACLAELCVMKPVSASFATYARVTMGPLAGFLSVWIYWLAWAIGVSTEFLSAGDFFSMLYHLQPAQV